MIWDTYATPMYRLLLVRLRAPDEAEEVLQDVFLELARKPRRLLRARNLQAYLLSTARNRGVSYVRRQSRRRATGEAFAEVLEAADPGPDGSATARQAEALLMGLPPEQREVISMKCYDELTFRDIGEVLGISPHTAASRYRYGIDKLQQAMRNADHEPT